MTVSIKYRGFRTRQADRLECSGKDKIAFICICIFLQGNIEWLQPNRGGGVDRQCKGFILETVLRRIERERERREAFFEKQIHQCTRIVYHIAAS